MLDAPFVIYDCSNYVATAECTDHAWSIKKDYALLIEHGVCAEEQYAEQTSPGHT